MTNILWRPQPYRWYLLLDLSQRIISQVQGIEAQQWKQKHGDGKDDGYLDQNRDEIGN